MSRKRYPRRGDLLPWFTEDHGTLPEWYLQDCREFFKSIDQVGRQRPWIEPTPQRSEE